MYQALYRKYRPKTFEDVIGQNTIVTTLKNTIANDRITHAYLFTGPRGTGKTSVAKLFAKLINCEDNKNLEPCNKCVSCTQKQNTDIIEMDAASNNGVDEIREIRDKVNLVPSFGKYKVYIVDEVHMLSNQAFNALLKTLEEPPAHVIFILATTEPHKIPETILSRCQRYDFKKISEKDICQALSKICKNEKIRIDDEALNLVAKISSGGLRDAISLLDQLIAYTSEKIEIKDVNSICGTITKEEILEFLKTIYTKQLKESFNIIDKLDDEGKNLNKIVEQVIDFLKNTLIFINDSNYFDKEDKKLYEEATNIIEEAKIYDDIEIFLDVLKTSKTTNNIKLLLELSIIKITKENKVVVEKQINTKEEFAVLEEKLEKIETKTKVEIPKVENIEALENLKNIRISNTLAKFNKKELIEFKKQFSIIEEMLMDPKYSNLTSLLLDGEVKAKGDANLIFVYKIKNLEEAFNKSLIDIEKLLKKSLKQDYKPIAVFIDDWEEIKEKFNKSLKSNKKVYTYQEENINLKEIFDNAKEQKKDKKNQIEEMFDEEIVYN